jgi:RNA-directed DNA polymerase
MLHSSCVENINLPSAASCKGLSIQSPSSYYLKGAGLLSIGMQMQLAEYLCSKLLISENELDSFLSSAPNKYKVYSIPKRSSGTRIIAHPAQKLKAYQRQLVQHLETILPVHPTAFAYRRGVGIKDNARYHSNGRYLLKMDFQNFFHSITPGLLLKILKNNDIAFTKNDERVLCRLLFWRPSKTSGGKLVLSIGAPSSPLISNFIMFLFDEEVNATCKKRGIKYTRYADDLTFSTNVKHSLFEIPALVKLQLKESLDSHTSINEAKTVFSSKAHNRHITGVTLTNDGKISIGRSRKRYISSMIHKFDLGLLPKEDISYLQGLLAFASDIEPDFICRMAKKYTQETINVLLRGAA